MLSHLWITRSIGSLLTILDQFETRRPVCHQVAGIHTQLQLRGARHDSRNKCCGRRTDQWDFDGDFEGYSAIRTVLDATRFREEG